MKKLRDLMTHHSGGKILPDEFTGVYANMAEQVGRIPEHHSRVGFGVTYEYSTELRLGFRYRVPPNYHHIEKEHATCMIIKTLYDPILDTVRELESALRAGRRDPCYKLLDDLKKQVGLLYDENLSNPQEKHGH